MRKDINLNNQVFIIYIMNRCVCLKWANFNIMYNKKPILIRELDTVLLLKSIKLLDIQRIIN